MDKAIVLKLKYGEDVRRVSLSRNPHFTELIAFVNQSFPSLTSFTLQYLDDFEDLITLASEDEVVEACNIALKKFNGILKVLVVPKPISQGFSSSTPSPSPSPSPAPAPSSSSSSNNDKGKERETPRPSQQQQHQTPPSLPEFIQNLQGFLPQFLAGLNPNNNTNNNNNNNNNNGPVNLATLFQSLGLNPPSTAPSTSQTQQPEVPDFSQYIRVAQEYLRGLGVDLDIYVDENNESNEPQESSNSNNNNNNNGPHTHFSVQCDVCGQNPIVGARYKCTVCHNFDLCTACEGKKVHNPEHALLKIIVPRSSHGPIPRHPFFPRACPYFRPPHQRRHLARFVDDVTLPDGTHVLPNTPFVKIWRLRNEGSEPWPQDTVFSYVSGDILGASDTIPVGEVKPGEEYNIAVDMKTPEVGDGGHFVGYWTLSSGGHRFGQKVWIDIVVDAVPSSSPSSSTPTTPSPSSSVDVDMQAQKPTQASVSSLYPTVAVPVNVAPSAPQEPVTVISPEEQQTLELLREMGFQGDLLALLRHHRGDINAVLRSLVD